MCGAAIFLSQDSAFYSNYSGLHETKELKKTWGIVEVFQRAVFVILFERFPRAPVRVCGNVGSIEG